MPEPIRIEIDITLADTRPETVDSARKAIDRLFNFTPPDHGPRRGRIEFTTIGPVSEQKR